MKNPPTLDELEEFWATCARLGLPEGLAKWLGGKLPDRALFLECLEKVGKTKNGNTEIENTGNRRRYAELVQRIVLYQSEGLHSDALVDKISLQDLKRQSAEIISAITAVRQMIADFILPAEEIAALPSALSAGKRQELVAQIKALREDLHKLCLTETAVTSAARSIVSLKRRTVFFPMPVLPVFDRQLARIWQCSGGAISTDPGSQFAEFLENTYRAAGREIQGLSDRLEAARKEMLRTTGVDDVETELHKRQEFRWRRAFDRYFRGRGKIIPQAVAVKKDV